MSGWAIGSLGAVLLLGVAGCAGDPVIAVWEVDKKAAGTDTHKDEIEFMDEGMGERDYELSFEDQGLYFTYDITWDFDWEQRREGEYELQLECRTARVSVSYEGETVGESGCGDVENALEAALDFDVDCELSGDETELDCDFGGDITTYQLIGE